MNVRNVRIPKSEAQMAFYVVADGHLFDDLPAARMYAKKLSDFTVRFIVIGQSGRIISERVVTS